MGMYVQGLGAKGKAKALLALGAEIIKMEEASEYVNAGFGVVCVVDNGPFEAAAYINSESEMAAFSRMDGRPKTWLVWDKHQIESRLR